MIARTSVAAVRPGIYHAYAVDATGNLSLLSGSSIVVDDTPPAVATINAANYNSATDTLTLTGAGFNRLLSTSETSSTDIKDHLDWSKLGWDIGGDGSIDVSFTVSDIASATVAADGMLNIMLTSTKATALEATFSRADHR